MRGGSASGAPCTSRRPSIAAGAQVPALRARNATTPPLPVTTPRHGSWPSARPRGAVACRGLFGLGLPELAVIAGVTALIFGPSKLPELGKGLGKTVKSFQTAAKEFNAELKAATSDDDAAAEQQQQQQDKDAGKEQAKQP